ncbi:noncompact myelin-associated protein [Brachionichthys hirsutus]|uniref:noncompact myelin-associated protein n=1 Tax=Brachionichthys hirsutus TaxID=412623 RepID=UPI0036054350
MQASTVSPETNTTVPSNSANVTKSREQILIQSSGAMIAVIVIGVIVLLAILLIIMKTYNKHTRVSRVLGASGGSKPRHKAGHSPGQSSIPLSPMPVSSVSGSVDNSNPLSENSFRLPRAELSSVEDNNVEQFSTNSGSTEATIHDAPSEGNT